MDQQLADILKRLEGESPTERARVAEDLCGDDQTLLARVMASLSDGATLEAPPDDETPEAEETPTAIEPLDGRSDGEPNGPASRNPDGKDSLRFNRPDRIGPFRIEGQVPLGRGGFGEVWEASRAEGGFRQRVAIKVISRASPDDRTIRRFELERQVLATLDHPDIARLIDGGELEDGRPWLAMEYVDGTSITRFSDRERLSIDERVRLFMRVALAVQHAHENLVVHRDIKPENVMVTAKGDPKLLDFGIAKLVNPELGAEGGRVTQIGEGILTPDYAAPEQFTGESIGTRADVYSLGVLLYELLTGRLPHHDTERGYVGIRTAKLEQEPPRPSDAVSTGSVDPKTAARITEGRDTGLDRLKRRLDGDLDVIILKALRREASRRYSSPRELVTDLQRHLEGLPVEARPDSIAYRTTRFVARHRAGVALTAASLIAATFGAVALATAADARATRSELEAASARADAESARAETAELVRSAFASMELEAADDGRQTLTESLQVSGQLDAADQMAASMIDRLEAALRAAPGDVDLVARRLGVELQRARLQWQRRNPSFGNRDKAAALRQEIASGIDAALADHPDHPDLLLLAALVEIEESDALPTAERGPRIARALDLLSRAETASGRRFDRNRAMLNTDRGDALAAGGESAAALEAYEASHAAHLARGEEALRDLAILETRMASLHTRLGDDARSRELHEGSLERRLELADRASRPESARARRDLALGHWYLADAVTSSSPALARRHLRKYLDLAFEVAWLDPLDRRGSVDDLQTAMARAARLVSLNGGDPQDFVDTIERFRRSIVGPRLEALPDNDARRLAIRADRYLVEVDLAMAVAAEGRDEAAEATRHRSIAAERLDAAIPLGRTLAELERDDGELTAEIGLCLLYRALADPNSDRAENWFAEAEEMLALSKEQGGGGRMERKLDRQLSTVEPGTTR